MFKGVEKLQVDVDTKKINKNSLRVLSLEDTYKNASRKLYELGITRFNILSDLDVFSIPVVSVTRPRVSKFQLTTAQGKGLTLLQSSVSALMEAVERHAGETYSSDLTASVNEITSEFIAPSYFNLQGSNKCPIDWIKGISLVSGNEIYIPAARVIFPYIPTKGVKDQSSSSNGIASGNTLLEATLHGLLEVIERHVVSLFLEGKSAKYLDLETLPLCEKNLVKKITKTGANICILDLSEIFNIPVYFSSLISNHPFFPGTMVAGQGCHVFNGSAIRRSITEAIQSHAVSLQGSREDLIRHHSHWQTPDRDLLEMWTQAKNDAIKEGISHFKECKIKLKDIKNCINYLVSKLMNRGFKEIIVVNLTHPEVKIPVTCVVVPGLQETQH